MAFAIKVPSGPVRAPMYPEVVDMLCAVEGFMQSNRRKCMSVERETRMLLAKHEGGAERVRDYVGRMLEGVGAVLQPGVSDVHLKSMTCLCLRRAWLLLSRTGAYDVSLVPMICFPDPAIKVDYELRCVGHFDTCDECGGMCTCSSSGYDEPTQRHDVVKAMLLDVAWTVGKRIKAVSWACVGGALTSAVNHRAAGDFDKNGALPSAYDLGHDHDFPHCSYGTGAAYVRVAFPASPDMDFTFAVVCIDHDT